MCKWCLAMEIKRSLFEGAAIPAKILSGPGCRAALPDLVDSLGLERLLIVTGEKVRGGSSLVEEIASLLGRRVSGIFDRARTHAPEKSIGEAAEYASALRPDGVLSIGGGSVHDAAKAVAAVLPGGQSIGELTSLADAEKLLAWSFIPLPVITVPTTLSAAEVVGGGIFTKASTSEKLIFNHPKLTPALVILDAEAASTTPRPILFESAMNAVHHCLEALYSRESQRITDAFALHAFSGLMHSLPRLALQTPGSDPADLQDALDSSSLSGLAYANSGLGIGHAICHSLGGRLGISHGGANSVILPHSLRFNMEAGAYKMGLAASVIGISGGGRAAAERMAERINELVLSLQVPRTLRELGVPPEQFDAVARDTMRDPLIDCNPRAVTFHDVVSLLEKAW